MGWIRRMAPARRPTKVEPVPLTATALERTRRDLYRELSRADRAIQRAMAHADEIFVGDGPAKS